MTITAWMTALGCVICAVTASAQDKPSGSTPASISAQELELMNQLHTANVVEIEAADHALKHGKVEPVKRFARVLQDEHRQLDKELLQLAQQLGVTLQQPAPGDRLARVRQQRTPPLVDREFITAMSREHEASVGLVKNAQNQIKTPALRAWLDKTLPILQRHHDQALQQLKNNPF